MTAFDRLLQQQLELEQLARPYLELQDMVQKMGLDGGLQDLLQLDRYVRQFDELSKAGAFIREFDAATRNLLAFQDSLFAHHDFEVPASPVLKDPWTKAGQTLGGSGPEEDNEKINSRAEPYGRDRVKRRIGFH